MPLFVAMTTTSTISIFAWTSHSHVTTKINPDASTGGLRGVEAPPAQPAPASASLKQVVGGVHREALGPAPLDPAAALRVLDKWYGGLNAPLLICETR